MQNLRRMLQQSAAAAPSEDTFGLRVASVFIVAIVSFCGCGLAMFVSRSSQGGYVNRLLKCTAAGVIACVGFVHILPDSAELLGRVTKYPLAYVIAMSGAFMLLLTNQVLDYVFLTVSGMTPPENAHLLAPSTPHVTDSQRPTLPTGKASNGAVGQVQHQGHTHSSTQYHTDAVQHRHSDPHQHPHHHHDHHHHAGDEECEHHCHHELEAATLIHSFKRQPLLIAYMLEFGIVFHSVIIGLGLGVVTGSASIVKTLLVAICFHQFFEGAGLSACIIDAELGTAKTVAMITIFSITTSFGIALGIGISSAYDPTSLTSCLVQGAVNAFAAGILIYLTLVDMVAEEFGKREVRGNIRLQLQMFGALVTGAAIMSVIAIWA